MTHILLDIKYNILEDLLIDIEVGSNLIYKWCNYNSHNLVCKPLMYEFPIVLKNKVLIGNKDKSMKSGYTGIGILSESHISIHTYPENNMISIDFYSCKDLDYNKNIYFIKENLLLNVVDYKLNFIKREQYKN